MKRQMIIVIIFTISYFVMNNKEKKSQDKISYGYETIHLESKKVEEPIIQKPVFKFFKKEEAHQDIRVTKSKRDRRSPATTYPTVSHKALTTYGFELAHMMYAIKKEQYEVGMGSIVKEQGGLVYFESDSLPPEFSSYVAIDNKNSKIYPISNTLKLQNVDLNKRFEVLQQGFEEFYYSEELKIMYVQAPAGKLFEVYDLASNLSLSPEVEVIRAFHKTR